MANERAARRARFPRQRGAAMVEMAIVVSLFMLLFLSIFEFALAIYDWSRVVEATRAGARYAIVNNPECPGGWDASVCATDSTATCVNNGGLASNSPILLEMQRVMGESDATVKTVQAANVTITYACANVGFANRPADLQVSQVTVATHGIEHAFIIPGMLGIDATMSIPAFTTTRIGEDLYRKPGT